MEWQPIVLWSLETVTFNDSTHPPASLPCALALPMLKWTAIQLFPMLATFIQRFPFQGDHRSTPNLFSKSLSVLDVLNPIHLPLVLDTCTTQGVKLRKSWTRMHINNLILTWMFYSLPSTWAICLKIIILMILQSCITSASWYRTIFICKAEPSIKLVLYH